MSLDSWNDGPVRQAILDYLDRIDDVAPADRIAVVDNDGTLWCEKPTYTQALFILQKLGVDPAHDEIPSVQALLEAHAGITTDEFDAEVAQWLEAFRHPRFGVPFTGLVYAPMLELLALLREHQFRVFVVTGGGVDFVRPVATQIYGVEPDDVVGSAIQVEFAREDGRVVLNRTAKLAGPPDEGPPKVVNIHGHIGRRPLVAIGNSAGDAEMLEYAHTGSLPSLCLVVNHDDEEREYAYGGAALTNPDAEDILVTAKRFNWTVVSMRDDWSRVFG
ncbi:haloacid dehalogenase-like hydrolase [Solirubrobacter taibaiensis]|nr:haloacid dehalogenase-like hydrolase [Solirubrobacter taibaiensis]